MKIEVGATRPEQFQEYWPGQYSVFSHFEFAAGIPQILFAITTRKADGQPNIAFHSWSCFQGGGESGYFAILAGLSTQNHTYHNIKRTGEFAVNFIAPAYYDAVMKTIQDNSGDEFAVAGLTQEPSKTIDAPRIAESFLTLECKAEHYLDLAGNGKTMLVAGRVQLLACREEYAHGIDQKYGNDGFMFNVHTPLDLTTGKGNTIGVATLQIDRTY